MRKLTAPYRNLHCVKKMNGRQTVVSFKNILFLSLLLMVSGCVTSPPIVSYSDDSIVTIRHTNWGMLPVLTPEVRNLANKHCRGSGGEKAVYTGIVRDSGVGPEEFDFECIRTARKSPRETSPHEPSRRIGFRVVISASAALGRPDAKPVPWPSGARAPAREPLLPRGSIL